MIEIYYGALVIIAGGAAIYSHCEMLQKVMITLFVGWVVYVNAQTFASFADRVELNLYLDLAQLGFVSLSYLSWRECRQSNACHWVCGCFAAMISLHIAQATLGFSLYWYYFTCNVLFTIQLISVIWFSRLAYIDYLHKQYMLTGGKWRKTTGKESLNSKVVPIRTKSA